MDICMDKMNIVTKLIIFYPMVSQTIPYGFTDPTSMVSQGIPLWFHRPPIRYNNKNIIRIGNFGNHSMY